MSAQPQLPGFPRSPGDVLRDEHYLGPISGGTWREDEDGVLVFDAPTARGVPTQWLELVRWCITGGPNAGSRMWAKVVPWLRERTTTVVSYSDPSVGHTGALYRSCGWLWAPTWHRLRPPPTGNGAWSECGGPQSVKDRWVYLLKPDEAREAALAVKDDAIVRGMPWAQYREPRWKRGVPQPGGGADFARWRSLPVTT